MAMVRYWNNWGEVLDFVERDDYKKDSSHDSSKFRDEFTGTKNWEEAMRLAREGWIDGATRALPRVNQIVSNVASKVVQPKIVTDCYPTGRGYDITAMLSGDPEHWYRIDPSEHGNFQHIKLSISLCQSCGISARVIEMKGAALAALSQAFELNGQSCQIQVDYSTKAGSYYDKKKYELVSDIIQIKGPDQPLDLTSIIFAIGHASSLRRIGFALWENGPKDRRMNAGVEPYNGYGSPQDCEDKEKGDIHIPSSHLYEDGVDWNNEGSVTKWITAKLEAFGVNMGG